MAYQSVSLERELFIKSIYTIHYYEYQNDFYFDGERHNFWEFQCVDTGAAEVVTDNGCYTLSRGQVIFHRPNEFHTLKATGRTAPRVVVISLKTRFLIFLIPNAAFSAVSLPKPGTAFLLPWMILIWNK